METVLGVTMATRGFFQITRQRGIGPIFFQTIGANPKSYVDGGGTAGAARIPVVGRATVAKFVAGFPTKS